SEQISAMAETQPEMKGQAEALILTNIEDNRRQLGELIARQDGFLISAGISPTLFRWMGLYNHMLPEEQQRHCAASPHMFVYPPAVLSRFNLTIDQYDGPDSQASLEATLAAKGLPTVVCYWHE